MNNTDLKIWLIAHNYSREQLANELGQSRRTIDTWCGSNGKPPKWLALALNSLVKG